MDNRFDSEKRSSEAQTEPAKKSVKVKSIKQQSKGRGRINIIDIILIIAIGVFVFYLAAGNNCIGSFFTVEEDNTCKLEYTVKMSELDSAFSDSVAVGDKVYLKNSGEYIGIVTEAVSTASQRLSASGVLEEYVGHCDITVKIRIDAEYVQGKGYTLGENGNIRLAVGRNMDLRFSGLSANGYCTAISVINDTGEEKAA